MFFQAITCLIKSGSRDQYPGGISELQAEQPSDSLTDLITHPITEWKKLILNDFEDFAFKKYPIIGKLKNELYNAGALFSLMSGSGSSVYGIFQEKPKLSDKLKEYIIYEGVM